VGIQNTGSAPRSHTSSALSSTRVFSVAGSTKRQDTEGTLAFRTAR